MRARGFDPTRLEIFKGLFHSVAEEMGAALRRSAFSPNIKERRDYSCAVFDAAGNALAMGDHMPVHLGSMPRSVAAAMQALRLNPGDIALLNDPYAGGTHLPDLTMVMPVYLRGAHPSGAHVRGSGRSDFYVANRAHHADIGGAHAGSMSLSREIFEEGVRIPPVKIFEGGRAVDGVMKMLLANVRTPREREGDLTAQVASCRIGERRLAEIVARYGRGEVARYSSALLDYSEAIMRSLLRTIPNGTYRAADYLDDDGIRQQAAENCGDDSRSRRDRGGGFYRVGGAVRGERERGGGDHRVGGVLRVPVPARRASARNFGADAADSGDRAGGNDCECAATVRGGGRERRDIAEDR